VVRRWGIKLCVVVLLLSGCWDRREINDVAFVVASAVDREGKQYRATLQIALPGQMGRVGGKGGGGGTAGRRPYLIDSVVASSVREANDRQQKALSRQLYFAHRRVFLLGEETARTGIESVVDVLARVPQNRLSSYVLVTEGPARDVLAADAPMEQFPAEMAREMAIAASSSPQTLKTVVEALIAEGRDPFTPLIGIRRTDPGPSREPETLLELKGLAVFRGDRLAGFLKEKRAMGMLWALGQTRAPTLEFPSPSGDGFMSVQFREQTAAMTPTVQGERITVHLVLRARGTLVENNSRYALGSDRNLARFEENVNREVASMVTETVKQLQALGSDPLGIGDLVHRRYPQVWHRIGRNWETRYPEVKFVVESRVRLINPGALVEPLGVPTDVQQE
jgi:spore germination protein KC